MKEYLSIGETAKLLGISVCTLRRWDRSGQFKSIFRTFGNHRRYRTNQINKIIHKEKDKKIIGYARVSSHDQKNDLVTQANRLKNYCNNIEVIEDLGSGLNYKKKGLKQLINLSLP